MTSSIHLKSLIFAILASLAFSLSAGKTVKMLCIGNSFTVDAAGQHLAAAAQSVGYDAVVGYFYIGGTTMEQHWNYIATDSHIYDYRKFVDCEMNEVNSTASMSDVLADEEWDYVVIQTDHNYSGVYEHYFPWLRNMVEYFNKNLTNKNAKVMLYMTWAYDSYCDFSYFSLYDNDQKKMYDAIVDCAFRAAEEVGIDVIPVGTAIQNCRTSYIGDHMCRDGYHLTFGPGRYTASCTFVEKILGASALDITYTPSYVLTDALADVCRNAAHFAVQNPKSVTSMAEKWGKDPDAGIDDTVIDSNTTVVAEEFFDISGRKISPQALVRGSLYIAKNHFADGKSEVIKFVAK